MTKKVIAILTIILLSQACKETTDTPAGKDGWLKGSIHEKLDTVAQQLCGFDNAMVETDYRYIELYWAGQDRNWEYASYQHEKIRTAIESGLQRRPKRAPSAQTFLNVNLPNMGKIIASKDSTMFLNEFKLFTDACNTCHKMEKVTLFSVKTPLVRQSSIRK